MNNQLMDILKQFNNSNMLIKDYLYLLSYLLPSNPDEIYTLYKDYFPENITEAIIPVELRLRNKDLDIRNINKQKFSKLIKDFTNTITNRYSGDALINFYNNIYDLNVKVNLGLMFLAIGGDYSLEKNEITVSSPYSIFHELFHMSSSYYDCKCHISYSGFWYSSSISFDGRFIDLGSGIDEGYTELLAKRYFGEKYEMSTVYTFESSIASKVEKIIGRDRMEELYFKADVLGFINELKKYTSLEETIRFISVLDYISVNSFNIDVFANNRIKNNVYYVFNFLVKTYLIKLHKELKSGLISDQEFIQKSSKFITSFEDSIRIGFHDYTYFPKNYLLNKEIDMSNFSCGDNSLRVVKTRKR